MPRTINVKINHRKLYKNWLAIEVVWPFLAFVIVSVGGWLLYDIPYIFYKTFSGLDLFPVTATILLGVRAEIEYDSNALKISSPKLDNFSFAALIGGLFFVLTYGICKLAVLRLDFPSCVQELTGENSGVFCGEKVDPIIFGVTWFSIGFMILGAGLAWRAKHELTREKERL